MGSPTPAPKRERKLKVSEMQREIVRKGRKLTLSSSASLDEISNHVNRIEGSTCDRDNTSQFRKDLGKQTRDEHETYQQIQDGIELPKLACQKLRYSVTTERSSSAMHK